MQANNAFSVLAAVVLMLGVASCNETPIDITDSFTLTGVAIDDETGMPLQGALVSLNPTLNSVVTDSSGAFEFPELSSSVESYTLNIELDGYRRFVRSIGTETLVGDVSLIANLVPTIDNAGPPSRPSNPQPPDGARGVDRDLTLQWSSTDDQEDDLRFDVYLGDQDGIERIATRIRDTFYMLDGLGFGESYTWQIAAYDNSGDTIFGPTWFFKTEEDPTYPLAFAYVEDGTSGIYTADADVEEEDYFQVTPPGVTAFRPVFSPDGQNIAYLRLDGTDTYLTVANADGSNERRLFTEPLINIIPEIYDFDWSPDGTEVVFGYLNDIRSANVQTLRSSTLLRLGSTRTAQEVTVHPSGDIFAINATSSDGLVTDILRYNRNNGLVDTLVRDTLGLITGPDFSPSGNELLVSIDLSGQERLNRRQLDATIFEIDLVTGNRRLVSTNKPAGFNDLSPTYSEGGGSIYFTRGRNALGRSPSIFRIDRNGTQAEEIIASGSAPTLR